MRKDQILDIITRYDLHNDGPGMDIFLAGMKANRVHASYEDSRLTIDGFTLPTLSLVVRRDAENDRFGFLVDVLGSKIVTYWPRQNGTYNWDGIIERVRLACRMLKADQRFREERGFRRFGEHRA